VDTAIFEISTANSNLAVALAQAAGRTVDVARLNLEKAQAELNRARSLSGGTRSADVINAEAGVATANAGVRDAILQDRLDTIDFQQNMDQITSRGAISMLTELLNMKDLTEAQRRDIMLKIKGLQEQLGSTMEGVFNLPESIKDASDVSGLIGPGSTADASTILREIQQGLSNNGGTVAPTVQDYSNSNNTVTINGADFAQVVAYLQQYLGTQAQVVTATTTRKVI
jgi:hypothetical protein